MANVNRPFGLLPARSGSGSMYNGQVSIYAFPTTDTTAYYLGDLVKAAASSDTNGVPNVIAAAGTDPLRGTIVEIFPVYPGVSIQGVPLSLENPTIPATKTAIWYVGVCEDPTLIYYMQDDGITTSKLVAASANLNFSTTITAGATAQSASASVILSSSFATTNTLQMKAQGLAQIPGNAFGAYAVWQCRINKSELTGSFVGV